MVVVWQLPEEGSHALYHAIFTGESPRGGRCGRSVRAETGGRLSTSWRLPADDRSLAQEADGGDGIVAAQAPAAQELARARGASPAVARGGPDGSMADRASSRQAGVDGLQDLGPP